MRKLPHSAKVPRGSYRRQPAVNRLKHVLNENATYCNCVVCPAGNGPYSVRKALRRNKQPDRGQIESEVVALLSVCRIGERRRRMADRTDAEATDESAEKARAGTSSARSASRLYVSG